MIYLTYFCITLVSIETFLITIMFYITGEEPLPIIIINVVTYMLIFCSGIEICFIKYMCTNIPMYL